MKKYFLQFLYRGLIACGFGPIVFAILHLVLQSQLNIKTITVEQMCKGIFSLSALAFIAGGMNVIYQIERLPLMIAILIHGSVLYLSYLATYLLNDWIELGITPILVFSAIFVVGYFIIWLIIYLIIKRNTHKINTVLEKQNSIQTD